MWQDIISWGELVQRKEYGFCLERGEAFLEGFVLLYRDQLHAWRNSCPHRGLPLNWSPHQFLDREGQFIICAMHGAIFQPDDGLCVHGPCLHERLQALPVRCGQGQVQVYF